MRLSEGDISMKKRTLAILASAAASFTAVSATMMSAFAEESSAADKNASGGTMSMMPMLISLVLMFVLLYFMAIKPQKKREQEMKDMQNSLQVGDEVITSGGIVGIIVRIGEDTVVIETGGERHKLRIKNWGIAENVSATERAKEAAAAGKKKSADVVASAKLTDDEEEPKSKKKKNSEEE